MARIVKINFFQKLTKGLQKFENSLFRKNGWSSVWTVSFCCFNLPYPNLALPSSPIVLKTSNLESMIAMKLSLWRGRKGLEHLKKPYLKRIVTVWPAWHLPKKYPFKGHVFIWSDLEITPWEKPFPQSICWQSLVIDSHWLTSQMSKAVKPVEANTRTGQKTQKKNLGNKGALKNSWHILGDL